VLVISLAFALVINPMAALGGAGALALFTAAAWWRGRQLASRAVAGLDTVAHELGLIRCPAHKQARKIDPSSPPNGTTTTAMCESGESRDA